MTTGAAITSGIPKQQAPLWNEAEHDTWSGAASENRPTAAQARVSAAMAAKSQPACPTV